MREAARQFVKANFDADKICLPRMMSILRGEGAYIPEPRSKGYWPGKKRDPLEVPENPTVGPKRVKIRRIASDRNS
jgi:hypothetical protein